MKPLLLVFSGLPFSGKSSLAKKLSKLLAMPIVSYDFDIYERHKNEVPEGTSSAKEFDMIEGIAREYLSSRLRMGESLIYDDLCLEKDDRDKLRQMCDETRAQCIFVFLDTPLDEIQKRRELNAKTSARPYLADAKLQLDMSLLEKPTKAEDPILVTSDTPIDWVVKEIRHRSNILLDGKS